MKSLSESIARLLRQSGIKPSALASAAGISRQHLNNYLSGASGVSWDKIIKLASVAGTEPDVVFRPVAKGKRYVIHTAVLPNAGLYDLQPCDEGEALTWMQEGDFASAMRYPDTAAALEMITGISIPVEELTFNMQPGDEALIFRLVFPPGSPRMSDQLKGKFSIEFIIEHSEFSILKRIS